MAALRGSSGTQFQHSSTNQSYWDEETSLNCSTDVWVDSLNSKMFLSADSSVRGAK